MTTPVRSRVRWQMLLRGGCQAVLLGVLVPYGNAAAQAEEAPYTDGLVVGVNTAAVTVRHRTAFDDADYGWLLGAMIGYGVSRYAAVFLGVDLGSAAATGASGRLIGHADLGVRLLAASQRRTVPYAELAFTGFGREYGDVSLFGNAFTVGAGAEIFRTANSSLDLGLRHSRGEFDERRSGPPGDFEPIKASTTRLIIGLKRRPPRS